MAQPPPKGISEPSYPVHRPETEGGPSAPPQQQTSTQEQHDHRPNTPPPYSAPTSPLPTPLPPRQPLEYPGLPRLDYSLYSPQSFTRSSDATTLISQEPTLSIYPAKLLSLIQSLATVPPKPQIQIEGRNTDGGIDFNVRVNCMGLILPEDIKKRMTYVRTLQPGELGFRGDLKKTTAPTVTGGLEEWTKRFCADTGAIKHFVLERSVTNWDTSYLEGRLLSLVSGTGYPGRVTISFPLTHSKILIRNPDKVNKFFSSVTKVFTGTKKYEVVQSIWPYADVARGTHGRRVAVQDEEQWFLEWKDVIRHAILGKRRGWVTIEDKLEFLMEPIDSEQLARGWGPVR